ncbi:MAG: polysaccharide biosynthesis protein [Lachnospiraceae bacterium]|nr:polysaccharide biosynthesis protein [Lachnospiraceae bacterium]
MRKHKLSSHPLITGTLLLTLAGLLSRIIGFFYRIFLSHTIGAEGLGIYQLIFPIYALTFSLTVAGIQTAISKFVAEAVARKRESCTYLYAGLLLSLVLSFLCTALLYLYAQPLAVHVLDEPRCAPLLRILSLTVPFGAVHACINGYYYGLKRTTVPALSQLLEQAARVGGVYVLYLISLEKGRPISTEAAVWGLVIGEVASVLYSVSCTRFRPGIRTLAPALGQIFAMALPLTANRVLINLLQSVEAIQIPLRLREFGYSSSDALSVYGVLTGMAMPMVLFPSVITNSVSVMLLPAISEAAAKENTCYIRSSVKKSCFYCLTLGFCCTLGFLLFGRLLGRVVFANVLAGTLLVTLGWICPFLYLTTTLCSILNGLGRTTLTFLLNLTGCGIRILFVWFFIPVFGIRAFLIGMLVSYLCECGAAVLMLRKHLF